MSMIAMALIGLIALLQLYIMWFEMFAWTSRGPKIFSTLPRDLFEPTTAMAANQGLYNGFIAAGLIWSLLISDPSWQVHVATFFLLCVGVAGAYGALTVSRKILFAQFVPAMVALIAVYAI